MSEASKALLKRLAQISDKEKYLIEGDPNGLGAQLSEKAGDSVLENTRGLLGDTGGAALAAGAKTIGDFAPMILAHGAGKVSGMLGEGAPMPGVAGKVEDVGWSGSGNKQTLKTGNGTAHVYRIPGQESAGYRVEVPGGGSHDIPTGDIGVVKKYAENLLGANPEGENRSAPQSLIDSIKTPEQAAALKGADRQAYLDALDQVQGPRAQRAAEEGWGKHDWYHGTSSDISAFDPGMVGNAGREHPESYFFSRDPRMANEFAEHSQLLKNPESFDKKMLADELEGEMGDAESEGRFGDWHSMRKDALAAHQDYENSRSGENVLPVRLRSESQPLIRNAFGGSRNQENINSVINKANDGVIFRDMMDSPFGNGTTSDVAVVKNPNQIRSVNAAFDKRFTNSSNLLAAQAGVPMPNAQAFDPDKYLAEKTGAQAQGKPAFDPDKYLAEKTGTPLAAPKQDLSKLMSVNKDDVEGMINGKFNDTGRNAFSPGEKVDSYLGVPVRKGLDSMAQGKGLIQSGKDALMSTGADPKTQPTGFDVANHAGIENPYLGTAAATAADLAQVPVGMLAKGAGKAGAAVSEGAGGWLKNLAEERAFKALGPDKASEAENQAKGLINSIGRDALDNKVVTPLSSKKTMLGRANELETKKSGALNGLIDEVNQNKNLTPEQVAELEKSKFVPANAAEELKAKIRKDNYALPEEKVKPRLDDVDSWLPGKDPQSIKQTQDFKTQMQKFIKDPSYWKGNPNASQDVLLGVRRAAKEGIEKNADAYAGLLGEDGGKIKSTNRELGNAMEMGDILDDRISTDAKNRTFSLSDHLAALAAHSKYGLKGLAMAPVNWFMRNKGSQLMATGADSLSKNLLTSPEFEALMPASLRGSLQGLAEKDPEAAGDVMKIALQNKLGKAAPMAADNDKNKKKSMTAGN